MSNDPVKEGIIPMSCSNIDLASAPRRQFIEDINLTETTVR